MKTLSCKGYIGSIKVIEPNNCLYGKVLDLPKGILKSYEGETIKELKEDFKGAIDDYLSFYEKKGYNHTRHILAH